MSKRVVLASKNAHKMQELQTILRQYGIELILQSELGLSVDVDETGSTFEENALLKAQAVMRAAGLPAIADDSGLVVDALGGEPGIYSARYGGAQNRSDSDRLHYLLRRLEDVPETERTAHFVCVITLVEPDGSVLSARGECAGQITREARGESGFGYDPIFYVPQEGCTFAEMPQERKNAISHRANALRRFAEMYAKENQKC